VLLTSGDLLKLFLAILAGGLIGVEREFRDKAAGFRTLICICLGATLFTLLSSRMGGPTEATRIASGIVTGVGFLGAGAILRNPDGGVSGLTTAASIWLVAAVGMAIGEGVYLVAAASTGAALLILWVFPIFEGSIDNARHMHIYRIVCPAQLDRYRAIDQLFSGSEMRVLGRKRAKSGDKFTCSWWVSGSPRKHELLEEKLLAHPDVQELSV
jgi:putative Mg2+ transporter-C (MgtC) family protein